MGISGRRRPPQCARRCALARGTAIDLLRRHPDFFCCSVGRNIFGGLWDQCRRRRMGFLGGRLKYWSLRGANVASVSGGHPLAQLLDTGRPTIPISGIRSAIIRFHSEPLRNRSLKRASNSIRFPKRNELARHDDQHNPDYPAPPTRRPPPPNQERPQKPQPPTQTTSRIHPAPSPTAHPQAAPLRHALDRIDRVHLHDRQRRVRNHDPGRGAPG